MKKLSYEDLAKQNIALADMLGKSLELISRMVVLGAETQAKVKETQILVAGVQANTALNLIAEITK